MKRRLFKLTLFLVLGAIASVTVTWLTSYGALRSSQYRINKPTQKEIERVWSIYGLSDWPDVQLENKDLEMHHSESWVKLIASYDGNRLGVRRLICRLVLQDNAIFNYWLVCEVQAGWPARCLRGGVRHWQPGLTVTESVDALLLPESNKVLKNINPIFGPMPAGRIFVYRPIWWGLIINSMFYAILLFTITRVCSFAHHSMRRKRGLCIKCGYNLRGDYITGCPECGWGREAKA